MLSQFIENYAVKNPGVSVNQLLDFLKGPNRSLLFTYSLSWCFSLLGLLNQVSFFYYFLIWTLSVIYVFYWLVTHQEPFG